MSDNSEHNQPEQNSHVDQVPNSPMDNPFGNLLNSMMANLGQTMRQTGQVNQSGQSRLSREDRHVQFMAGTTRPTEQKNCPNCPEQDSDSVQSSEDQATLSGRMTTLKLQILRDLVRSHLLIAESFRSLNRNSSEDSEDDESEDSDTCSEDDE